MSGTGRSGQPDYSGTVLGPRMVPATHERRTIILNDSEIVSGAPPLNRSASDYGKFFPRGMRGTIEEIRVYCRGAVALGITINLSIQPNTGPMYRVSVTPLAAWGWVDVPINVMWNYDSMYIWISYCHGAVFWGYDEVKPYDGHFTDNSGVTFTDVDERPFIRVVMTGETAGDVPISGVVNNIEIPSISSKRLGCDVPVPRGVSTLLDEVDGIGYVDLIIVKVNAAPSSHRTMVTVYCDGPMTFYNEFAEIFEFGLDAANSSISLTRYGVDNYCVMVIHKPFRFRRHFRLEAYNNFAPVTVVARAYPTLLR